MKIIEITVWAGFGEGGLLLRRNFNIGKNQKNGNFSKLQSAKVSVLVWAGLGLCLGWSGLVNNWNWK